MKSLIIVAVLCSFLSLSSCSDSTLVENWKNPEIETFQSQKVLVLAMSSDVENRVMFENLLVDKLLKKGVNATNSDALFNTHFTSRPRTEEELQELETDMLLAGYDAILVSKVTGSEQKGTLLQNYLKFNDTFNNFGEDYIANQRVYGTNERIESYTVYHAQSILYCICPDKERQLIWRGAIDVTKLDTSKKAIKDYINMLLFALEEQNLLIIDQK